MRSANDTRANSADQDRNGKPQTRVKPKRFLFLALVLLGFAFYFSTHPERLPDWSKLRWPYFIPVIGLSILANLTAAFGWHAILKNFQIQLGHFQVVRIFILGRTLNLISPQGGTLYAALSLKSSAGLDYSKYAAAMTASLWLDLTLASLSAAIVLMLSQPSGHPLLGWLFLAAFLLSIVGVRLTLMLSRSAKWEKLPLIPKRTWAKIREVTCLAAALVGNIRLCLVFGSWALANTIIHGFRLWLCFAMVEAWIPWSQAFATTILVKASNTVAITPGNIGIVEAIVGFMGSSFGLSAGAAVLAGLTYRFASYIGLLGTSLCFIALHSDSTNTPQ
jgi:uncharacterized membrane protein YbhN (UPF0104 family)